MMKRFETLHDDEISNAIAHVDEYGCAPERKPMLRCLFLLMANTGLRITEAVKLTWNAVDFERGEITVKTLKQHRPRGRRAESHEDTLPLDANTLNALQALKALGCSPFIFPDRSGKPLSRRVAYNIFQKLLHHACIRPVKLHCLRHSFITRIIEQTGDLTLAQALARHRSISSTAAYVHCRNLKAGHAKLIPIE